MALLDDDQSQVLLDDQDMKHQSHFHVLAVDDSLIDRKLLEKLLRISSCKVTCVESGSKALEFLGLHDTLDNTSSITTTSSTGTSISSSTSSATEKEKREIEVNLIITDYCMPGMSGYDLLTRVKKSSWKDVPVVVMSSENVPSRINRCLEGGAEEFLLKPVQLSDMKKLHPHLLKSLNSGSNSSTCHRQTDINNNTTTNGISNHSSDNNKSNINNGKRKATSPHEPAERKPKFKGLATL